jgi:hypothetical protein
MRRNGGAHRAESGRREPYTWLGAGAITLGVGAACASGCGIAHADEGRGGSSSTTAASGESKPAQSGSSAAHDSRAKARDTATATAADLKANPIGSGAVHAPSGAVSPGKHSTGISQHTANVNRPLTSVTGTTPNHSSTGSNASDRTIAQPDIHAAKSTTGIETTVAAAATVAVPLASTVPTPAPTAVVEARPTTVPTVRSVLAATLSALTGNPAAPADSPFAWVLAAAVRREIGDVVTALGGTATGQTTGQTTSTAALTTASPGITVAAATGSDLSTGSAVTPASAGATQGGTTAEREVAQAETNALVGWLPLSSTVLNGLDLSLDLQTSPAPSSKVT